MAKLIEEIGQQPYLLENLYKKYPDGISEGKRNTKQMYLIGTGASLTACIQTKYALLKYIKQNITVIPAFEADYYIPIIKPDSTVIILSQSGESYETRLISSNLKEHGIPYIALTNNINSYLAQKAATVFPLEAGVELGTATKTQTCSIMLLYLIAASGNKEALLEIGKIASNASLTIKAAEKYLSEFNRFLGEDKAVYITGLGMHASTAQQAGLMLKEKVFLHAEGLSIVEFRHGPVEAIENGTPVIIIADGNEGRAAAIEHAKFLNRVCGAKVCFVTDSHDNMIESYQNFPFVWEGQECFSHICATIPFQLLAEYMASQRGYDIDGFKFIGKILKSYEI